MKRSEINDIMAGADDFIRSFGFVLPPFAYWTPEQFQAQAGITRIAEAGMGWDITDFGLHSGEGVLSSQTRWHRPWTCGRSQAVARRSI